jgi:16S rRNA G966 N2-methylase RsmD
MKIDEINVNDIKPYEKNAKKHPEEQIKRISNSIKAFGFKQPLVIDKDNVLVIGHGRLEAAKRLGFDTVPCVRADDLTEDQIKALRLADNKTNESDWDFDFLNIELDDITDIDMSQFGFDLDIQTEEAEIIEDEAPDDVETRAKLGDVWELGEHRLICGDCTDIAVIDTLMGGVEADLLLTDPPYGINVVAVDKIGGDKPFGKVGGGKIVASNEYAPIIGDDTTDTARACYDVALTKSKEQIIFGGNYFTDFLPPSRCWVVWDKQNTGNFADAELAWTSFDKGVKLYHFLWNGLCREGSREVEGRSRVHPTQKPVGMLGDILKDFTKDNDTVLDMFGGSGSTLIACEQLGRKCYICELDEHYCDVIIQRWENFTGKKAVLIDKV